MAKWRFQRDGSWDYPQLGLWGVVTGDAVSTTYAPDAWWSEVAPGTAVTKTVSAPPPAYSEPTDGAVQVWDAGQNRLLFQDPGFIATAAVSGHNAATDPHGDRAAASAAFVAKGSLVYNVRDYGAGGGGGGASLNGSASGAGGAGAGGIVVITSW